MLLLLLGPGLQQHRLREPGATSSPKLCGFPALAVCCQAADGGRQVRRLSAVLMAISVSGEAAHAGLQEPLVEAAAQAVPNGALPHPPTT